MPTQYDHYKVLGVSRHATATEIKRAYRDLVKQCHPDRASSPASATIFHAVHHAYTVLMDPAQRERHDALLLLLEPRLRPVTGGAPRSTSPSDRPDMNTRHWAFIGLHLTGLLFGLSLLASITVGIVFLGWPSYVLFLSIPGLVVIPDSWDGLRMK
jgi:hypothetical protein